MVVCGEPLAVAAFLRMQYARYLCTLRCTGVTDGAMVVNEDVREEGSVEKKLATEMPTHLKPPKIS